MFPSTSQALRFKTLSLLVAAAAASAATACGGLTDAPSTSDDGTPSSSGSSGSGTSPSDLPTSPGMMWRPETVDETRCEYQRASTTLSTPSGAVCAWTGLLPCTPALDADAGADAGGVDADAGVALPPYPTDADLVNPQPDRCKALCNAIAPPGAPSQPWLSCQVIRSDKGLVVQCGGCGAGRPPRGFTAQKVVAADPAAAWLAEMSQLEAASVAAFHALHADLARLGAPASLLAAIRIAAADEVRHASLTRHEAELRGATVPALPELTIAPRTAEQIALENAEEGCVKETFGAVLARVQAARAADPSIRALMERIAADELGHAALSWRVASWLEETQLDAAARARVASARRRALDELDADLGAAGPGLAALGIPDAGRLRVALAHVRPAIEAGLAA